MSLMLCSFMSFFSHKKCSENINQLTEVNAEHTAEIKSLNSQIICLLNQVQEQRAIFDYQSFSLEKIITELKAKLKSSKRSKRRACSVKKKVVETDNRKKGKSNDGSSGRTIDKRNSCNAAVNQQKL